ncbi:fumarate hydratase [bacterium]|nr:fumarate hydratase [bacterium]
MREVAAKTIIDTTAALCQKANYHLPDDVLHAISDATRRERSYLGRKALEMISQNAEIAAQGNRPICQDCGAATFFVELGSEVRVVGMTLDEALNAGTRKGYLEGYLRTSMVYDPLLRNNSGDNTPPSVHIVSTPGDAIRIRFMPKGAGSDNVSKIAMLSPSDGIEGIKETVIKCVDEAGAKPCPPITVGIGIGGTVDTCVALAKKALFRRLGSEHNDLVYRNLEKNLYDAVNRLGIGPLGFGGTVTALAVHIEARPCHIASLPVAVNLQCHAFRRAEAVI